MTVIEPRLRTSFFVRMAILVGIPTFFGWVILVISRVWTPMVLFAGVAPGALTVAIILWSWLRGVRRLDDEGVTRRDGRRFLWSDLRTAQDVRMLLPGGAQGPLNNIDLHFRDGVVKVFPLTFANMGYPSGEGRRFVVAAYQGCRMPSDLRVSMALVRLRPR